MGCWASVEGPVHSRLRVIDSSALGPLIMSILAMAPSLFAFYMSSSINFTVPHNLFMLRVLYGVSIAAQLITGVLVYLAIQKKNDQTKLDIPAVGNVPASQMTVHDFDMAEVKKYLQGIAFGVLFSLFIHLKMEAPVPLFINIFFGLFKFWEWQMVRLNLLGESGADFAELRRPFPVPPSPFAGLMKQFTGGGEEEEEEVPAEQVEGPRVEVLEDGEEERRRRRRCRPSRWRGRGWRCWRTRRR